MEQQPLPPRAKVKLPRNYRKIAIRTGIGISLVLVIIAGYYVFSLFKFANDIYEAQPTATAINEEFGGGDGLLPETSEAPEWKGNERINILLLGGDTRGVKSNSHPRSDTMMVVSINPVDKSTHIFSILRDTYTQIPKHGSNRINTAITMGGPHLAMETISQLMDLPIHYYVYTDFEGFISLIDAIGGIELEVDKNMRHIDNADDPRYSINLRKGQQQLDGLTALQYVRYRGDALSDFARSDRQRQFLSAISRKMKSTTSLLKLPQVLNSIAPYIETSIPPGDLLKLARLGLTLDTSQMAGIQIPPAGKFKNEIINKMDVLTVVPKEIQNYVREQLTL